jgi:hypothetical protein
MQIAAAAIPSVAASVRIKVQSYADMAACASSVEGSGCTSTKRLTWIKRVTVSRETLLARTLEEPE